MKQQIHHEKLMKLLHHKYNHRKISIEIRSTARNLITE